MKAKEDLPDRILGIVKEGVIVVDKDSTIIYANRRAASLLGLGEFQGPGHEGGRAEPSDVVILADTCLSGDDGGLVPRDLILIGVNPENLRPGDAFLAIGTLNGQMGTGVLARRDGPWSEPLEIARLWPGKDGAIHKFSAYVSEPLKKASISVDAQKFDFDYQVAIGHMVILDSETLALKFYETPGYTARGEDAKKILLGAEFRPKKHGKVSMEITGEKLWKVCPDGFDITEISGILSERISYLGPKDGYINGIPLRYSLIPLRAPGNGENLCCIILNELIEIKELSEKADAFLNYASLLRMRLGKSISLHPAFSRIVGKSKKLAECVRLAEKIAPAKCNILLLGESGTGKNLLARALHQASPRHKGPFISVNCAAIPPALMETELFGYASYSFGGGAPKAGKKGRFHEAQGGTLFLDEVSELDMTCQAKLLHAIEEGSIQPFGAASPQKIDVRIIAATNQDLRSLVNQGRFRDDLYYRLNVFPIFIPPLRERPEDIQELTEMLLQRFSALYGKRLRLTKVCFDALLAYSWPGNVRELENVLERAALVAEDGIIDLRYMPPYIYAEDESSIVQIQSGFPLSLDEARKDAERNAILQAIQYCHGNHTKAMRVLKIGRTTFYQKMKELNIPQGKYASNED